MKILKYLTIAISMILPIQSFATHTELEIFNDSDEGVDIQVHGYFTGNITPAEMESSMLWSSLIEMCNEGISNTVSNSASLCAAEVYLSPNSIDQKALGVILINLIRGNIIIVRQRPELTGYKIVSYGNGQLLIENNSN
ncbi:hypothetical protein [Spartinivicinus ruber]|uniref:hypothetical protein n=1 Tax=Spartinivicinus ruber TaxID=2683272 RepID=UPI0013D7FC70|nr:hypothetical protein [Spartinivicinus ruber]